VNVNPQLFDPSLEFTEGFLRPMYLGSTDGEPKKGNLICRDDTAFLPVDPEFELQRYAKSKQNEI
jgi:hypothetical protein